jgi:hypothetical protein
MRHSLPLLALVAACGQQDERVVVVSTVPAAPATPDPIVKGVPHGGQITHVALTEQADAALTFDNTGGVRLWPALDGSRTPVPVATVAPDQLALSHAGRDLLAAILDEAGSVRLMRLGRDGSVRGDVQLDAEVRVEQVIALDDGALVRREDHVIEWFSADGVSRGRLVAEPSKQIRAIAARQGSAVAILDDGTRSELRWLITLGNTLSWGGGYGLPTRIKDDLVALSPSHRRIAFVDPQHTLAVYELGLVPVRLGNTVSAADAIDLGFVDEDHVALMGNRMQWWAMPAKPAKDPWEVTSRPLATPSTMMLAQGGATADGIAVMGFGAALSLADTHGVKYLGYREHGVGNAGAVRDGLWISMSGSRVVWLDNHLAVKREIELRKTETSPWIYATPVSDRHVVTQSSVDGSYKLDLVDVDKPDQPISLGTFTRLDRVELAADSGILGISAHKKLHRFKVDLATGTVTPLPALKTRGSPVSMRLFDPAISDGITAITVGWANDWDEDYTLTIYRERGKPSQLRRFRGRVIDMDERGTIYLVNGDEIQTQRGDQKVASFKLDRIGAAVAVSADGSRFAVQIGNDVVVVDDKGVEQWRKPLWGTQQLLFTKDGNSLAVRANGGLVMLDAASGERKAMECGWSFALMTTPPQTNALAFAPVCEDPMI